MDAAAWCRESSAASAWKPNTFLEEKYMPTTSDRLRKQAKKVTKELHKMNSTVKDAAQEKLQDIRNNGSEHYDNGRRKMRQTERRVTQLIRNRPLRSALIATALGVVLGGFMFRRLRAARVHTNSTT
jgi:ElaB/YqjD/DUF883 family membrane-anchored ribosome-binding protein